MSCPCWKNFNKMKHTVVEKCDVIDGNRVMNLVLSRMESNLLFDDHREMPSDIAKPNIMICPCAIIRYIEFLIRLYMYFVCFHDKALKEKYEGKMYIEKYNDMASHVAIDLLNDLNKLKSICCFDYFVIFNYFEDFCRKDYDEDSER
jgi:hypothetical protein